MKYRVIPEAPGKPVDFDNEGDARVEMLEFQMHGYEAFIVRIP